MEFVISTDSIAKRFGSGATSVAALQGVNINVKHGEIYSLLGPNGAGKTTFIKCLLGIIFPTGGSGHILGEPLGSVKAKARLGYLPENHKYPLHLTGEQVLNYFGKLSGLDKSALHKNIDETLHLVGMQDWRTMKVRKYSKGMMQRLGLAQALINDPDLIILDEPTDGVDPVGRKEIRDILARVKDQGKTVFLNSHLLSEVERVSDRVAIMQNGQLIREGTVNDLTAQKNLYSFKVETSSLATVSTIFGKLSVNSGENGFDLEFENINDLNSAIDKMRSSGILIESILPKKTSLEDLFISLIQSSDVTRAH
jgi:ABC-2 type transport system ATP-binding protein